MNRNKYRAVKVKGCPHCGRTHDSKAEASECAYLHMLMMDLTEGIVHIDAHPTVTLPGNIRWVLDFCVWYSNYCFGPQGVECGGKHPVYIDVKGVLTEGFRLKRKLFDKHHPAAPLVCVKWNRNKRTELKEA